MSVLALPYVVQKERWEVEWTWRRRKGAHKAIVVQSGYTTQRGVPTSLSYSNCLHFTSSWLGLLQRAGGRSCERIPTQSPIKCSCVVWQGLDKTTISWHLLYGIPFLG